MTKENKETQEVFGFIAAMRHLSDSAALDLTVGVLRLHFGGKDGLALVKSAAATYQLLGDRLANFDPSDVPLCEWDQGIVDP